ncbi:MAG: response regulator transcription factor [Clostridia bacterium]|nr:response regulator transcription factor [Clostridia bacterium]
MNRILIVEDELAISESLKSFLEAEGFLCETAGDHASALEKFENGEYDLVLMDVSLPGGNGFVLCSAFKRIKDTPVIFLTASGDEQSTLMGLELGAEDYVAKPFRPRELVLRIKNVLRRTGRARSIIALGNVTVDTEKGVITKRGAEIRLSALEYRLLLSFINNRGRVMTRSALLEHIWDASGDFVNDNTLTVYIKRLRDKLEDDPQFPTLILTVRNLGYKLAGEE